MPQVVLADRDARPPLALAEHAERLDAGRADPRQPDRGHAEAPQQELAFRP